MQQLPVLELLTVELSTAHQRKVETLKTRRVDHLRVAVPFVLEAHDKGGECIAPLANGNMATSSWDELVRIWHPANEPSSKSSRQWTCIREFKVPSLFHLAL
jgi:hypothetical protein